MAWLRLEGLGATKLKAREAAWRTQPLAFAVGGGLYLAGPGWKQMATPVSQATLIRAIDLVAP